MEPGHIPSPGGPPGPYCVIPYQSLPLSVLLCLLPPSQERDRTLQRGLCTLRTFSSGCLEAVFKVLETSEEGNPPEANRSLGQALPLLRASFADTSQLPMAKNGILQKWALLRTQMYRFGRDPIQECLPPIPVSLLPTHLPEWDAHFLSKKPLVQLELASL